jgi:plasmid stability protein
MASLTIKGIPDPLLDGMRRSAELHRRSLNSEALVAFERNVQSAPLDSEEVLALIRALHDEIGIVPHLTPEEMEDAINEGRP